MQTLMQDIRYGSLASEPGTFLFVASLLDVIALAACYIPARSDASVAATVALRYE
jgi:ABC-type lipoprotein release transport system permease subunit